MKHARDEHLDQLESLLEELRKLEGLREKKRGVFYRKSRAFLHFHDDPAGLYADVRLDVEFERYRVSTKAEQRTLLGRIRAAVSGP
jgi:hypothetical protein